MQLQMVKINKSFGANKVLNDVDFELDSGEIVALLGANGAGKSTLMKIMTGVYGSDSGSILVDDSPVDFPNSRAAMAQGIRLIPQELSVLPDMSVSENVFLGAMPCKGTKAFSIVDFEEMTAQSREMLGELGLDEIDAQRMLREFNVSEQRLVEIARALVGEAKVLVMDEPTASLSEMERDRLFAIMRHLRESGTAIVFISHYLDEVFEISDRIEVLRDGVIAGSFRTNETNHDTVLEAMLGRELENLFPDRAEGSGKAIFAAKDIHDGKSLFGVDVSVSEREIHGVFGLIGSGVQELGKVLFGGRRIQSGEIRLNGEMFRPGSPAQAIRRGVGFVAGERKSEGIVPELSLLENLTLPFLAKHSNRMSISRKKQLEFSNNWIANLGIRTTGPNLPIRMLSGGNQQKVCIGRWLVDELKVLILEEPTRGVDLGARKDIYRHLRELSNRGLAVIVVSSDAEEVAGLSDSSTVLKNGQSVARFDDPQAPETLMRTAGSSKAA